MKSMIVGCPFDNGIRSMLRFERGITGAADGPNTVSQIFMKEFYGKQQTDVMFRMLPLQKYNIQLSAENIHDVAFRKRQKKATIEAHEFIAQRVSELCRRGYMPIGVGGDHSITYPLCRGVCLGNLGKRFGVIYIDAHFDMRPFDRDVQVGGAISSGNAFRRIITDKRLNVEGKNVVAIGIHNSGSSVYKKLARYARSKGVTVFSDDEVRQSAQKIAEAALTIAGQGTDLIYFSLDIDAVSEIYAPGVSAPADSGISEEQLYSLVEKIAENEKVAAFDIAEVSSRELAWFEIIKGEQRDESREERLRKLEQTARVAARAIDCFLESRQKSEKRL